MARYQLRDMLAHVLYDGGTLPYYDPVALQWVTPDRVVAAPAPERFCVVSMPDLPPQSTGRMLTHVQYMGKFTPAELAAIYGAAQTNAGVQVWLKRFELAEGISLDDPITIQGLHDMEMFGLLAAGRAAEITA